MRKRRVELSLAILLVILLGGCAAGSGDTTNPPQPPNPSPNPDFSIAVSPDTVTAPPGGASNAATISVTGTNGFTGQTTVSIAGLPQGATVTPTQPFAVAAGSSQQISIAVPASTAPGSAALTVTGTSGQLNHSAPLALVVTTTSSSVVRPPAPTLPAPVDSAVVAMPDTTGYTDVVVGDMGDPATNRDNLQTEINNASCNPSGTVIRLAAGVTYRINGSTATINLPAKNCAPGKWIIIRSDAPDAALPPPGTRIDPSFIPVLPRLETAAVNAPVFRTALSARNYRLMGLLVTMTANQQLSLIEFGDGDSSGPQDTVAEVPTNLVADRCLIRGSDSPPLNLARGVGMHCGQCAVIESWIDRAHQIGFDSQAIAGWNGTGPILIRNNYLEAAAENVFFGGADTIIPNNIPSDITIERNHFFKSYTWRVGHPSYAGTHWTIKNLLELKMARRVLIEGNVMENCWADAQECTTFIIKSENQGGRNPWAQTADVTIRYNRIIRAEGGAARVVGLGGNAFPNQLTDRVYIHDNLFEDVGAGGLGGGSGGAYYLAGSQARNVRFEHNTLINAPPNPGQGWVFTSNVNAPNIPFGGGISIHDNVMGTSGTSAPIDASESCAINGVEVPWACFDNPPGTPNGEDSWHRNLVYHATTGQRSCNSTRPLSRVSPWARNKAACVGTLGGVGFVDLAGRNFRLAAGSTGKSIATDGQDVGADIDLVEAKTAGVK